MLTITGKADFGGISQNILKYRLKKIP